MLQAFLMWLKMRDDEGQGLVEYAVIIALVAIAIIVGLTALGVNLNLAFQGLADWVDTNITSAL